MSVDIAPRLPARPFRWRLSRLTPLIWVGPAVVLIGVVVILPVIVMIQSSLQKISPDGFVLGDAGFNNFTKLFAEPAFVGVLLRTAIWTIGVVVVTMVISLALAQLFNARFPGRRFARWALIVPWAASVMMTALIFRWALDSNNGAINVVLNRLGLLDAFNSNESAWLGNPPAAFGWMMLVAIFVSLPFSTYAILSGLQSIPEEIYEAADLDGATKWSRYRAITLPLLRPAIIVAVLINVINVFNSFPIIWEMTRGGPAYATSTTTTFMFTLKQSFIGESAAMSVINFAIVIIIVVIYLRSTRWKDQVD
ncbi:carbohydrate ABC transporter permease [Subtercola lobariae]|uniref:ABC transporter permease n=1 Tax=Subtercola lobariae TaxID=1588641 RepID=A0A917ET92_9MICO|nr:sugar ABC transporter permease [Subtercola lobariae]GGF10414.1 ABC transporter permease [Subtercola lobariae]